MSQIEVFNNEEFGSIRVIEENGKYLFCGLDAAKAEGLACGLKVYPGLELRLSDSPNDYLLYGVTEEFLLEYPRLYEKSLAEIRELCDRNDMLLVQAHPYREGLTRANPQILHGVEVHNGNPRHNSHNDLALRFAEENGLLMTSGSDYHNPEDCNRGGMLLPVLPQDGMEIAAMIKSKKAALFYGE